MSAVSLSIFVVLVIDFMPTRGTLYEKESAA